MSVGVPGDGRVGDSSSLRRRGRLRIPIVSDATKGPEIDGKEQERGIFRMREMGKTNTLFLPCLSRSFSGPQCVEDSSSRAHLGPVKYWTR